MTKGPHPKPQTINLKALLDRVFSKPEGQQNVEEIRDLVLALIENGQRHDSHGFRRPPESAACARKGKRCGHTQSEVYCRYLFPRELFPLDEADMQKLGEIYDDPYRPDLRNLRLRRNDALLNNFEQHMLLANLGNIDWRALINLWSVLDYLTKYATKPGTGSKICMVFSKTS